VEKKMNMRMKERKTHQLQRKKKYIIKQQYHEKRRRLEEKTERK
jgi:hypothetical protein